MKSFNPTPRILMGPGPSDAHPRVLKAMATPLIGHLDPVFVQMMDAVKSMLQQTMLTKNHLTTPDFHSVWGVFRSRTLFSTKS